MAKYKEEVTLKEKRTLWRVYYNSGSRVKKTKPMTADECLAHFKKAYAVSDAI